MHAVVGDGVAAVVAAGVAAALAAGLAAGLDAGVDVGVDAGLALGELVVKAGRHSHTLHSESCHHSGLTYGRSALTVQNSVASSQTLDHWPLTAQRQLKSGQADKTQMQRMCTA